MTLVLRRSRAGRPCYGGPVPSALALIAVVLALLASPTRAHAWKPPSGPLFSVVGVSTYEPTLDGDRLVLRIPLTVRSDVSIEGLRAQLYDVELPGRREATLFDAFGVKLEPPAKSDPRDPVVLLDVAERPPLPPGAYRVRFAVISSRPAAQRHLAITVRLAAPALAAPPILYIDHSLGAPWDETSDSGLVLRDVSDNARLSGLSITQVQAPGGPSQPVGGDVNASAPGSIEPDSSDTVHVKTEGGFPLGTSTGQLQISSPQLAQPMLVTYQVHTKVWPIYLLLTIFAGVLLGFLTRVWLVQRIERGKALVQAFGLLDQIRRERQRHADADFQKTLREASEELESLLTAGSPEEITAAVKTTTEALRAAQEKLRADIQKSSALIASLEPKLGSPMALPTPVEKIRAARFAAFQAIRLQLESDDAAGATKAAEELQGQFDAEARSAGESWCKEVMPFLQAMSGKEAIGENAVLGSANPELSSSAMTASKEAQAFGRHSTPEDLAILHNAVVALTSMLSLLRPIVAAQMTDSMVLAGYDPAEEHRAHNAVWDATERFKVALANADARQAPTVQALLVALRDLSASLAGLIRLKSQRAKKRKVNEALDEGNFVVAAQESQPTDRWVTPRGTPLEVDVAQLKDRVNAELAASVEPSTPSQDLQQQWRTTARVQPNDFAPVPTDLRQVRALRELAREQLRQTILLGLIIIGIGYLLLADNFVGTRSDFLSAFAWGYTADITTAFVVNALQGKSGQPSAQAAPA